MAREARWRLMVGAAPIVGLLGFALASVQGEAGHASSPLARTLLALVAASGTAVAWWTARQRRRTAPLPVARAAELAGAGRLEGAVVLRGRASALPDAVPLISPDGELCLWFRRGEPLPGRPPIGPSVRPFLLSDDSGDCIVLPAGASVTGRGAVSVAAARSGLPTAAGQAVLPAPEQLLRSGERIRVSGRFVAASTQALALQAGAAALVARSEAAQAQMLQGDPPPSGDLRAAALAGAPFVAAPPFTPHGLALPVIGAAGEALPLTIHIGADDGEGALFGVLAAVDGLVLVFATTLLACSVLLPA